MSDFVVNQHYIPQCVLEQFSMRDQVREVLLKTMRIYPNNYRNSMSERLVYEHSSLETNALEKYFSSLENSFAPDVKHIIEMLKQCNTGELQMEQIKAFVGKLVPIIIIFYYRSRALLHEFEFQTQHKEDKVSLLLSKLIDSRYICDLAKTVQNYYEFAVIRSEQNDFLISDQYVSTVALGIKSRFSNASNRNIGFKEVMMLVPLSSEFYVVYYHGRAPSYIKPQNVNTLSAVEVDELNRVIINNSYIKCVGRNESAVKKALDGFSFRSPSATYLGFPSGLIRGAIMKKELFLYPTDSRAWDIFTSPHILGIYHSVTRNDKCPCGSGLKFKRCCIEYISITDRLINSIKDKHIGRKVIVNPQAVVERSIAEF